MLKNSLILLSLAYCSTALAHPTWIASAQEKLEISTGHGFPRTDFNVSQKFVQSAHCLDQTSITQLVDLQIPSSLKGSTCVATLKKSTIKLWYKQAKKHFEENKVSEDLIRQLDKNELFVEDYFKFAQSAPLSEDQSKAIVVEKEEILHFVKSSEGKLFLYEGAYPKKDHPVGLSGTSWPQVIWTVTDELGQISFKVPVQEDSMLQSFKTSKNVATGVWQSQFATTRFLTN